MAKPQETTISAVDAQEVTGRRYNRHADGGILKGDVIDYRSSRCLGKWPVWISVHKHYCHAKSNKRRNRKPVKYGFVVVMESYVDEAPVDGHRGPLYSVSSRSQSGT